MGVNKITKIHQINRWLNHLFSLVAANERPSDNWGVEPCAAQPVKMNERHELATRCRQNLSSANNHDRPWQADYYRFASPKPPREFFSYNIFWRKKWQIEAARCALLRVHRPWNWIPSAEILHISDDLGHGLVWINSCLHTFRLEKWKN